VIYCNMDFSQFFFRGAIICAIAYLGMCGLLFALQRKLLYFPLSSPDTSLATWFIQGTPSGHKREVANPHRIWLVLHGNGGDSAGRGYVVNVLPKTDSVYVLEYPGFGLSVGETTADSINAAAKKAFGALRREYPDVPLFVCGESLGTGPACLLAGQREPPEGIVLLTPYDRLAEVGAGRFPGFPVKLLMLDDWNNVEALQRYRGPILLFGARNDRTVPESHAKALAASLRKARYERIEGGHMSWVNNPIVPSVIREFVDSPKD
jgi:pimeloyl-ACP methyl ester carboxylesterase